MQSLVHRIGLPVNVSGVPPRFTVVLRCVGWLVAPSASDRLGARGGPAPLAAALHTCVLTLASWTCWSLSCFTTSPGTPQVGTCDLAYFHHVTIALCRPVLALQSSPGVPCFSLTHIAPA